jgi:MFS family permease
MDFVGQSTIAILVAAFVGFVIGGIWYGILGDVWMKAASIDPADMVDENGKKKMPVVPMVLAAIANLVLAITLSGLMGHMVVDVRHGLITAGFIALGFILPTLLVNYSFQGRPLSLTLIDAGHWLLVLLVMGAIIGYIGVETQ